MPMVSPGFKYGGVIVISNNCYQLLHYIVILLYCYIAILLYCWIVGLLDCWIVGLLDCWIAGLLDCWIAEDAKIKIIYISLKTVSLIPTLNLCLTPHFNA